MDFLRLHLPRLHLALRGALDSFSAFVSYLVGDTVPTVERETQAAEELGEVAAGKPGKVVEEEAQEVVEELRSDRCERVEVPGETIRCQEGSLAGAQTWEWRTDSSPRPETEWQGTGSREAAEGARGQEPNISLKPEAGPGSHRDKNSNRAQEIWERGEQEVSSGEPMRTCEQKEEKEEEVRVAEPGIARGVESQPTWHRQPEGNAGTGGQNVTEDRKETNWVTKEVVAETERFEAKGADKEEERMVLARDGRSARAQGTPFSGAVSEDWAMLDREASTASGREEAESLGVQEAEHEPGPGDCIPEATGRVWVLEEACKGDQQDEVNEKRETEVRLQTQIQETERTEEATEGQVAGREAIGDQETGGSFEDEDRQDLAIGDNGVSLEEEMQAEEPPGERRGCWATEAVLVLDKEAKGEPDLEESPEARSEELFMGEKDEAAQIRQEVFWAKVTEGQDPELTRGSLTSTKQPEEGQEGQEETGGAPDLSPEGLLSLGEYPRPVGFVGPELEAGGNWRRDVDSRSTQEVRADVEAREREIATGQAAEVQTEGGQKAQQPEVLGWVGKEGLDSIAVNQELEESQGAEAERGQSTGECKPSENKAGEGDAPGPWEADIMSRKRRPEEVTPSLQGSEDTQTSGLAAGITVDIRTVGAEEGPEWEAGVTPEREFGRVWHPKGMEEAGGGTELEEATKNQSGQEVGLKGSAKKKVAGYDTQGIDGTGEEEQAEMGACVMAEGIRGMGGVALGSQAERAEGPITTTETEGLLGDQKLLREETGGGQSREWKSHNSEGETQKLQDVKDVVSEGQSTDIQEAGAEGPRDVSGPERQQTHRIPAVAVPDPSESAETTAGAPGDAHSNWNEALLPGSLLDVSVPRSRVLLSRSSSWRRSRPSLRRISAPEPQYEPPSPQPQEELRFPEQSPLQPEETPELSATKPEGTPVPAKRKMPGHGFGLAHPGMMQELQARLSRPKPQ